MLDFYRDLQPHNLHNPHDRRVMRSSWDGDAFPRDDSNVCTFVLELFTLIQGDDCRLLFVISVFGIRRRLSHWNTLQNVASLLYSSLIGMQKRRKRAATCMH